MYINVYKYQIISSKDYILFRQKIDMLMQPQPFFITHALCEKIHIVNEINIPIIYNKIKLTNYLSEI